MKNLKNQIWILLIIFLNLNASGQLTSISTEEAKFLKNSKAIADSLVKFESLKNKCQVLKNYNLDLERKAIKRDSLLLSAISEAVIYKSRWIQIEKKYKVTNKNKVKEKILKPPKPLNIILFGLMGLKIILK